MNNDVYAEWLVKRKTPGYTLLVRIALIMFLILSILISIVTQWGFVVFILAAVACYFFFNRMKVEYEYIFVTNELAIDRVINQRSRKRVQKLEVQKMEKVASVTSHELDAVMNNPKFKKVDYTSGDKDAKVYGIVYLEGANSSLILFEPNEKILKALKYCSPRKVKID